MRLVLVHFRLQFLRPNFGSIVAWFWLKIYGLILPGFTGLIFVRELILRMHLEKIGFVLKRIVPQGEHGVF